MTTIAIMQPYFFPYLGYFQLLASVDKFVILDDVNMINRGWVNRNRILVNGGAHTISIPLIGNSQNKLICELSIFDESKWREKTLKTITQSYSRAPYFRSVMSLIEEIFGYNESALDKFLLHSLGKFVDYLGISVEIISSSRKYGNNHLRAQDRIIDICQKEQSQNYINPIGGIDLYSKESFAKHELCLHFLKMREIEYKQFQSKHLPFLSIVDVCMFNSSKELTALLAEKELY